ncbi:spinster family MFS transporter [Dactylosporangium sp. CS-033363]|uniref:spinster family MFS transporter n=1 Tax=Dactylosporangium sp. CS-033363 TaxID=3239935 RepID=UPI003D91A380
MTAPARSSSAYVLALLFAGNLLNFYDRALPAVVLEPIKEEYRLDDVQVGVLASAFVVVAAIAGVPLGRLADRVARRTVAGWGLLVWSLFTAAGGVLTNFWAFLGSRVGVGAGEASYAPATGSLLADLYPSERRARANAVFMLGFPIGTLLAYLTAGGLAVAFDTWRAPFLIAAIPGVVVALLVLRIREPERGAAEPAPPVVGEKRGILRVKSMYGLILAFAGYNFAAYAIGTFLTPVVQRYYGLGLVDAGLVGGAVIGVTGLLGLLVGGRLLDRAARRSPAARVVVAAVCLAGAALCSLAGLAAGKGALWQLIVLLGLGYLLGIIYLAAAVPVTADVIRPHQRSTAIGLMSAIGYLLGGAGGPIVVGAMSDSLAAGSTEADGLRTAMMIAIPIAFAVAALGMLLAARYVRDDRAAMLAA